MSKLPDEHDGERDRLLAIARADIAPCDQRDISKAALLFSVMPSRATEGMDAELMMQVYRIGLGDLPLDLLEMATEAAIKNCKFRPMPAEVRGFVQAELDARKLRLARLIGPQP